jgi:hypothetical protein
MMRVKNHHMPATMRVDTALQRSPSTAPHVTCLRLKCVTDYTYVRYAVSRRILHCIFAVLLTLNRRLLQTKV